MSKKPSTTTRTRKKEVTLDSNLGPIENPLSTLKIDIKHKNETQKKLTNSIKANDVTICTGKPGTGKTYLSCAEALIELKTNSNIKKIVLVKSVTTLKSEEIGFLKGTMEEKMEPFIYSFIHNFEKLIGKEKTEYLKTNNLIEVIPIAYMRGINIDNAIIIVDEVQNVSIENIRTILTRLGENSKMILLGDINQIDSKNKQDSALKFLLTHFNKIEGIGTIEFGIEDIIRHPLIKKIEHMFDSIEKNKVQPIINKEPPMPKKNGFLGIF
jgi:phosphate starvation-inducible PhoH-like protein